MPEENFIVGIADRILAFGEKFFWFMFQFGAAIIIYIVAIAFAINLYPLAASWIARLAWIHMLIFGLLIFLYAITLLIIGVPALILILFGEGLNKRTILSKILVVAGAVFMVVVGIAFGFFIIMMIRILLYLLLFAI